MANPKKNPLYHIVDGIRIPAMFSPKCFKEVLSYEPKSDDVFIATYPKCGTTWMQSIAMYIFRRGQPLNHMSEFFQASPYIDPLGTEAINKMPRPGAMKTHIPLNRFPYTSEAKYIIVARNPKDCCVSLYHHTVMLPGFGYEDGEFDDFFELFMDGEVEYDDYFDHLLSWYPFRNNRNVFYTTYEDMKENTEAIVLRLAKFLGEEYADTLEKDNSVLKNILHYSSFAFMKENLSGLFLSADHSDSYEGKKYKTDFISKLQLPDSRPKAGFVRKGEVGDWKNHLSEEQSVRLQRKFDEKISGTDIASLWSQAMKAV